LKVALVWPFGNDITYSIPLGIGYLVSNTTSPEHELRVFDGTLSEAKADSPELKQFLKSFQPDLIGVSCWSKTFKEALGVLRIAKTLNFKVITLLGGIHPTSYPDKSIDNPEVDYVLTGEAEKTFPQLLDRLAAKEDVSDIAGLVVKHQNVIKKNPSLKLNDLDQIEFPDYEAINLKAYLRKGYRYYSKNKLNAPVWFTRGCPYRCKFCTAPLINGQLMRMHTTQYAINWIKLLYHKHGIRHINIIDDNFTFYADYTEDFCQAIIKENLKGLTLSTANGIRAQRTGYKTLKLMKDAGWYEVTIAPESGSRRVLKLMKKDQDPDMWPSKVEEIHKAGLAAHAAIMVGYPGETTEDIKITEDFIRKCKFDTFGIQYFQPLPGTPIYDDLVKDGEIEDVLLPNTTTERRTYVTPALKDFNFAMFAFKMYFWNFMRRPIGVIKLFMLYPQTLILRRITYLFLDAFFKIGMVKPQHGSWRPEPFVSPYIPKNSQTHPVTR